MYTVIEIGLFINRTEENDFECRMFSPDRKVSLYFPRVFFPRQLYSSTLPSLSLNVEHCMIKRTMAIT